MACRTNCKGDVVPWSEFVPDIKAMALNVPPDVAEHYARVAVTEFAQRVMAIQRDIYIDAQACVSDYTIDTDDGYVIKSIREVVVDGVSLPALESVSYIDRGRTGYYFSKPCSVLVNPAPRCDAREGVLVRAVVAPSRTSCFVEQWVYDEYASDIVVGALSHIMLMRDAGWFDTTAGGIYARRWSAALARAKVDRARNHNSAPAKFKIPRWI